MPRFALAVCLVSFLCPGAALAATDGQSAGSSGKHEVASLASADNGGSAQGNLNASLTSALSSGLSSEAATAEAAAANTSSADQDTNNTQTSAVETLSITKTFEVASGAEFYEAQKEINQASSGTFVISLTADISLQVPGLDTYADGSQLNIGDTAFTKNNTTILGNGHTLYLADASSGDDQFGTLAVSNGATLNLGVHASESTAADLIITGTIEGTSYNLQRTPIYASGEGTELNIYDGVSISGCTVGASDLYASAVRVSDHAKASMFGGSISGNNASAIDPLMGGAAVAVDASASFVMTGGSIEKNSNVKDVSDDEDEPTYCAGGVFVIGASTFDMTGGAIANNTAKGNNCTRTVGGVFVAHEGATFNLKQGSVSDNIASGNGSYYSVGGVMASSTGVLNIDGGEIANNIAEGTDSTVCAGGVLACYQSDVTLSSGNITANETRASGNYCAGGVLACYESTVTLDGGLVDQNANKVSLSSYSAGGVMTDFNCGFVMNDGQVTANASRSTNALFCAGGVLLYYSSTPAEINGGSINQNTDEGEACSHAAGGITTAWNDVTFTAGETTLAPRVTENVGESAAGGIFAYESALILNGGKITNNQGVSYGGVAVWGTSADSFASLTLNKGDISGNTGSQGGGVFALCSALNFAGGTVEGNAALDGGGVYAVGSNLTMTGGNIVNNAAGVPDDSESAAASASAGEASSASDASASGGAASSASDASGAAGASDGGDSNGAVTSADASDGGNSDGTAHAAGASDAGASSATSVSGASVLSASSEEGSGFGGGVYLQSTTTLGDGGSFTRCASSLDMTGGLIANNTASAAAADIYIDKESRLVNLVSFDGSEPETFQGSQATLDNWYSDAPAARWTVSGSNQPRQRPLLAEEFLIAAYNTSATAALTPAEN